MPKLKALIVDDTKTARALLKQALQSFPIEFTFLEAEDGNEAVDRYNRERPRVIFIDLEMPRKNGLQAVSEIRNLSAEVDIVVVSSKINDKIKEFLKGKNVESVIEKPYKLSDIAHIMAKYVSSPIKKVNILVADDTKTTREILINFCRFPALEITFTQAEDGEKALIEFRTHAFDMVFLDVNMPKIDGIKVLQMMKRIRPSTRVIMLTSDRTESTIRAAISAGANGYVSKPFTAEQIHGYLDKLV